LFIDSKLSDKKIHLIKTPTIKTDGDKVIDVAFKFGQSQTSKNRLRIENSLSQGSSRAKNQQLKISKRLVQKRQTR